MNYDMDISSLETEHFKTCCVAQLKIIEIYLSFVGVFLHSLLQREFIKMIKN